MILHGVISLKTIIQLMKVLISWPSTGTKPTFELHSLRNTDVKKCFHYELQSPITGQMRVEMADTRLLKDIKESTMRERKNKEDIREKLRIRDT